MLDNQSHTDNTSTLKSTNTYLPVFVFFFEPSVSFHQEFSGGFFLLC